MSAARAATKLLFDQLCKTRLVSQRWIYLGQSHSGVVDVSMTDMLTSIAHRLTDQPAPDATAPTGLA